MSNHGLVEDYVRTEEILSLQENTNNVIRSYFINFNILFICRLPRNVLRFHSLRHHGARNLLGPGPLLRPLHLRGVRGPAPPPARAGRGLRTPAAG